MKIGDHVYWTHVSRGRRTLSMTLREGTIEAIVGDFAVIKKRSGREVRIALKRLRAEARETHITEFVEVLLGREA